MFLRNCYGRPCIGWSFVNNFFSMLSYENKFQHIKVTSYFKCFTNGKLVASKKIYYVHESWLPITKIYFWQYCWSQTEDHFRKKIYCRFMSLSGIFLYESEGKKIISHKNFYAAHQDTYIPKHFIAHFLVGQSLLV